MDGVNLKKKKLVIMKAEDGLRLEVNFNQGRFN
jgi:hypothetical protein